MDSAKRKIAIKLLVQVLLLFAAGVITIFITCDSCFKTLEIGIAASMFSGYVWIALWMGNSYGAHWLDAKIDWLEKPLIRLITSILFTVAYTFSAVALGYFLFFTLYLDLDFTKGFFGNFYGFILGPIIITFLISTFMHGRAFFYSWREMAVNVEKLKRTQLSSKYESLKNQVNPHFLFNSLNALTALVHKDADLSEKFIKKLSEVYRYVLDSQEKEVVDLSEELKFTDSFVFLQKIRHGESLKLSMEIPDEMLTRQVPPLAVQMLIENAIKHNIVAEAKPLRIKVFVENDLLVVANNLQKRADSDETSGLGINNIKMRYEYLSNQSIVIDQTEDEFIAKLPLLSFDK